jgi:hypothetical protein
LFYTIYRTVNIANNKEYVGFHRIESLDDILCESSENGSIFYDGYLGSGKLMKRALQKYGPLNMRQELILATEDQKEAEDLEKEIVCYEWVMSDENYNLSIGGNVTILFGEHNGFFGKKHTKETIEKIQRKRKETYDKTPFSWSESFLVEDETVTFLNTNQIKECFDIGDDWFEVNKLVYEGVIRYRSEYLQKAAIQRYLKRYHFLNDHEARHAAKEKIARLCSERFSGVPKTKESNEKRGASIKIWIDENPEKHQERMLKINKNPEKIRKTAEKHRGMKRSEETRRKISESKRGAIASNKGKICIHNIETKKRAYIDVNESIPDGWAIGSMGKRK